MVIYTRWWFVLPVDAPDTMMHGFPLPFICPGWHTSLSLQIFMLELLFDWACHVLFWFGVLTGLSKLNLNFKVLRHFSPVIHFCALFFLISSVWIAFRVENLIYLHREFDIELLDSGFQFIWSDMDRPELKDYRL